MHSSNTHRISIQAAHTSSLSASSSSSTDSKELHLIRGSRPGSSPAAGSFTASSNNSKAAASSSPSSRLSSTTSTATIARRHSKGTPSPHKRFSASSSSSTSKDSCMWSSYGRILQQLLSAGHISSFSKAGWPRLPLQQPSSNEPPNSSIHSAGSSHSAGLLFNNNHSHGRQPSMNSQCNLLLASSFFSGGLPLHGQPAGHLGPAGPSP